MDIPSSNNPIYGVNGLFLVDPSSFEVDDGIIGSSSLMNLNGCEASDNNSKNEQIEQPDQNFFLNQPVGQLIRNSTVIKTCKEEPIHQDYNSGDSSDSNESVDADSSSSK